MKKKRQYFSWHPKVREKVAKYVENSYARVDPERYSQERASTHAILGRLDGIAYEGEYGYIEFRSTIVEELKLNSAENIWGADFVITAIISQNGKFQEKVIFCQAKKGSVDSLKKREKKKLCEQIEKMKAATISSKVFELPTTKGGVPFVCDANKILSKENYPRVEFGDYIVRYIMTCIAGDIRPDFVNEVQNSSLSGLTIIAEGRGD